jgi:hypothetical protein
MKLLVCGCSITVGEGLDFEKESTFNYVNLVAKGIDADLVVNVAEKGNSNDLIFISAVEGIVDHCPDIVIVQWSALNRLWAFPTNNSQIKFPSAYDRDFTYNGVSFSSNDLRKFYDMYCRLFCDNYHIASVIRYSKILQEMHKNIVFVNGMLPWTKCIESTSLSELDQFTKELTMFESQSDDNIMQTLTELQDKLAKLDKSRWVNMFGSQLSSPLLDVGSDNSHPGPKSHRKYADMIIHHLGSKIYE